MNTILKTTSLMSLALAAGIALSAPASAFENATQDAGVYFAQEKRFRVAALQDLSRPTRQVRKTTRTLVNDPTGKPAGNITVDSRSHKLYLSLGGGKAMQYEIGVGRPGFQWSGKVRIGRMAKWPNWTPPPAMLKRRPDLPKFMKGGVDNPLGARALYLYSGKRDSMFRIHGTTEPETIGRDVSSGCIRMLNDDVADLYTRVKVGTRVTVIR